VEQGSRTYQGSGLVAQQLTLQLTVPRCFELPEPQYLTLEKIGDLHLSLGAESVKPDRELTRRR
jgi:hypothetical protein